MTKLSSARLINFPKAESWGVARLEHEPLALCHTESELTTNYKNFGSLLCKTKASYTFPGGGGAILLRKDNQRNTWHSGGHG